MEVHATAPVGGASVSAQQTPRQREHLRHSLTSPPSSCPHAAHTGLYHATVVQLADPRAVSREMWDYVQGTRGTAVDARAKVSTHGSRTAAQLATLAAC